MSATEAWKVDRIGSARAGTNPTVLATMPGAFAVMGDTQFLDSMDTLGQAVETACRATDSAFRRMNYEILGNTDAYLHAHLFPRYEWEPPEAIGGPVWLYDPQEFYGTEAALAPRHDELRVRIFTELANLTAAV